MLTFRQMEALYWIEQRDQIATRGPVLRLQLEPARSGPHLRNRGPGMRSIRLFVRPCRHQGNVIGTGRVSRSTYRLKKRLLSNCVT